MDNSAWWNWSFGRYVGAKALYEGEQLPFGYGIAWALPHTCRYYCLPVPLNRIIGGFRAFWLQVRRPVEHDPIDDAYRAGYGKGVGNGHETGMEQGIRLALIVNDLEKH